MQEEVKSKMDSGSGGNGAAEEFKCRCVMHGRLIIIFNMKFSHVLEA